MSAKKGHSNQYTSYIVSPQWRVKSNFFIARSGRRCVILPWKTATHSHHLTYVNLEKERYIRDCVPLSKTAHDWVHKGFIGKWMWDDIKGRRRLMNFIIRVMAVVVTVCNFLFGDVKITPKAKPIMRRKK
jgi:hypothetical protein